MAIGWDVNQIIAKPANTSDIAGGFSSFQISSDRLANKLDDGLINVKGFYDSAGGQWRSGVGTGGDGDNEIVLAAITEAATAGKTILFPAGIWKIGSLWSLTNCDVLASPRAYFIHGDDIDLIKMGKRSSWAGGYFDLRGTSPLFTSRCFWIDTAPWGPTAGYTYYDPTYDAPRIRDVTGYHNKTTLGGNFIEVSGTGKSLTAGHYTNIRAHFFTKGIYLYSQTGSWINSLMFGNINAYGCAVGMHLFAEGTGAVDGCTIYSLMTQAGLTYECGLRLENASDNLISGCCFWDTGAGGSYPNYYGIELLGSSDRNYIQGFGPGANYLDTTTGKNNVISQVSGRLWNGADLTGQAAFGWNDGPGTVTGSPGSYVATLTAGDTAIKTFGLGGAVPGDIILTSPPYDMKGCIYHAKVISNNTVEIVVKNGTGSDQTFNIPLTKTWKFRRIAKLKSTLYDSGWSPTIAAGECVTNEFDFSVTNPGLNLTVGDFVIASFAPRPTSGANISGLIWTATIINANKIIVTCLNLSGDSINLNAGSGGLPTWFFKVIRGIRTNHFSVVNPANLTTGSGETQSITTMIGLNDRQFYPVVAPGSSLLGCLVAAYPKMSDSYTFYIRVQNETGSDQNIGSAVWNILLLDDGDII